MKRILAYSGHLLAATLAVTWLTMLAGGLTYGIFSPFLASTSTPQQFLSDHLIFLAVVVGASLAYSVSGTFTSKSALWVWIPAATVFVFRVLAWRANGSALFGSGSLVEHFFTANCQIQNWREGGFESRCFDRLYVTQLFAGSPAYSAGAAIHHVISCWRPSKRAPTVGAVPGQLQILTTPVAAFLALALAGSFLGNRFHAELTAQRSLWQWLGSGVLSTWVVVTINIALWGGICLIGIGFARARFERMKKPCSCHLVEASCSFRSLRYSQESVDLSISHRPC